MRKLGLIPLIFLIVITLGVVSSYALIDDFNITGGAPYINNTYCYGDYLYILNDTTLQKWSLQTRAIVDTIEFPLLTDTWEVLRKGSRLYIDATINASRRLICVEIEATESFAVIANGNRTAILVHGYGWNKIPYGYYGLERVEYFDCNNHDVWTWVYLNSSAMSSGMRKSVLVSTFRSTNENPSMNYEKLSFSGYMHVGTEYSGNTYVHVYTYNVTSGIRNCTTKTHVGLSDHRGYYHWGEIIFNHTSDAWEDCWTMRQVRYNAGGTQYVHVDAMWERSMNIQHENRPRFNSTFFDPELYGSAFWTGWRSNDYEEIESVNTNNLHRIWMDTDSRVSYIYNSDGAFGSKTIYIARFDTSSPFPLGSWHTPSLIERPNTLYQTHGVAGMIYLANNSQLHNAYVGYVNHSDSFPKVDRIVEVSGVDCINVGGVDGNFTIDEAKVFQADKNLVALYVITGSNDIVVQRNLIDPSELAEGGYQPINFLNATLTYDTSGDDGAISDALNNSWLFEGEVYTLTAFVQNITECYLTLNDTLRDIDFHFENSTGRMWVDANYDLVAGLVTGKYTRHANQTYELSWVFVLDVNINDCLNVNMTYYITNGIGEMNGTAITGINIYNLGGFITYEMQGDGGRITGGDWMEIHQTNGTGATAGAYAEAIYRRLQHVHVLWSLDVSDNACFDDDEDTGYVYMGIQYLNSLGNWVDGWYMRLRVDKGAVDPSGGGVGKAWVTIRVQWYAMDENGTDSVIATSQYLSGYPECGDTVGADITRTRFYTDLWFNTANSSTTVGGRVNTYYYGMDEAGWMFWTDWRPIMLNMSEAMMFTDLRDANGSIIHPNEIELMKFWVRVLKVADGTCDSHTWAIRSPQFSFQLAEDRMKALNTPDGVETIIVDMPSTGWMQPIAKAIQGISNAIWAGALNFLKIMLGAVDSLLLFLNSPVTMSQMIQWIMLQGSYITAWMVYVVDYVSSMLSVFSGMITVLTSVMTWAVNAVIWVLTYVVGFPIAVLTFFVQIISGQSTVTYYEWTFDFSSVSGLIEGAKTIAPIGIGIMYMSWLFWGNIEMKGDIDETGVISRIMATFGWFRVVYNDLFWVFNRMRNEIISLYNFIRSHIPSLGGGGGEVEE